MRGLLFLGVLFVAAGGALLGDWVWMAAKARLAEVLITEAFAAHLADGRVHPPWSWADLSPTAELQCERLGVTRHVLSGGSGSSMAFGLGHLDGTALPNGEGNCVLVGHRDGQCAFLRDLRLGDRLTLRTRGDERTFVVMDQIVVSERNLEVIEPNSRSLLTLITCYPFGGLRTTPWRYVVVCERDPGAATDPLPRTYRRREPERSVLHSVVREHLETFLSQARAQGGEGYPYFIEGEFRRYLEGGCVRAVSGAAYRSATGSDDALNRDRGSSWG